MIPFPLEEKEKNRAIWFEFLVVVVPSHKSFPEN